MDPGFRSRLIAAIIFLIVVCSAFSVSPVAGFHLENRDGNSAEATLAEALVLQQSTKIRSEYMENLTVYIDSENEVFDEARGRKNLLGLYVPEENAIYIRSDQHPEQADDVFAEQVGYRVYHSMEFQESAVFATLAADPGPYLSNISVPDDEEREAAVFAGAFMLYHITPDRLEEDSPGIYAYMDLLAKNGGDRTMVDELYAPDRPE